MSKFNVAMLAIASLLVSAPAFAQVGGPDLPGGAKTTNASGKSTTRSRSQMKMKMSRKGRMTHRSM